MRCGACDNCLRLIAHEAAAEATATDGVADAPMAPGSKDAITVAFAPGERGRTRRHGLGVVREADAMSVTVEFANGKQALLPAAVRQGGAQSGGQPNIDSLTSGSAIGSFRANRNGLSDGAW